MLILSRRPNEKIVFPTFHTTIEVVAVKRGVVRLGIQAPAEVTVLREELQEQPAAAEGQSAEHFSRSQMRESDRLLRGRLNDASVGFALLSRQLQAGLIRDAETTVAAMSKEVQLLQQELGDEVEETEARVSAQPHKSKALLVEDNPNERELLATFLRLAGVDVDMTGDGADALDYLHSRGRPDVMLLDMGLPRCDGPTTVREIRRDPAYAGLKIFAVSAHAEEEFDLVRGPAGVDRWFLKPVDLEVLLRDLNLELDYALSDRP